MPLVWAQGRPAGFQGISSLFRVPSASAGSARSAGQAVRWLRGNMLRAAVHLESDVILRANWRNVDILSLS